jgi:hypothetical protein
MDAVAKRKIPDSTTKQAQPTFKLSILSSYLAGFFAGAF